MHSRLAGKLAALRRDLDCGEFILADAKDADMAWGAAAPGGEWADAEGIVRRRTMPEFRQAIRSIVEQGVVDLMLASTANYRTRILFYCGKLELMPDGIAH